MRGRTLNQAFVILDEAQNTTREQMKMFLTRIGFGSKAVVTGDVTQIDLPRGTASGLIEAQHVLAEVRGIAFRTSPPPTWCAIRWWDASSRPTRRRRHAPRPATTTARRAAAARDVRARPDHPGATPDSTTCRRGQTLGALDRRGTRARCRDRASLRRCARGSAAQPHFPRQRLRHRCPDFRLRSRHPWCGPTSSVPIGREARRARAATAVSGPPRAPGRARDSSCPGA